MKPNQVPTTVVTGALGSGKTTLILSLVKDLPEDYNVIWLKNEYGDVNIDSELAAESNIQTKEILNGCVCCVLIGRLRDALEEISTNYKPDRLIIETAGTAYPFPIMNEINQIPSLSMDGLITVVDALNFKYFKDKSRYAKDQAKYVDLVVINKVGLVQPPKLEQVMDEVYDLYLESTKIKTEDGSVDPKVVFGIDSKWKQGLDSIPHEHHHQDIDVFNLIYPSSDKFAPERISKVLDQLPKDDFYRIKGIFHTLTGPKILNYVAGRYTWQDLPNYSGETKLAVLGTGITNYKQKMDSQILSAKV